MNFVNNYINKLIEHPLNQATEKVNLMVQSKIEDTVNSFWQNIFEIVNNSLDNVGLILVMSTYILHMMSVPNAGRYCYTIFALYMVLKVVLKASCLI